MKRFAGISVLAILAGTGGALAAECDAPIVTGNNASFTGPILSALEGGGTQSCTTTAVGLTTPAGTYGVYEVDSRGGYSLAEGDSSSYSVTAFGTTRTVEAEGENFDTFTIRQKFATGLVGADTDFDGTYDLTVTNGNAVLDGSQVDVDTLDILLGYTTLGSQQDSLDEVGLEQLGLVTHLGGDSDLLRGGNQPLEGSDELGMIGGVGSYLFGITGRYNLADGFSLLGGASVVNLGVPGASASGVLGTGAVRYVDPAGGDMRFFAEGGVEIAGLGLSFSRHYDNGTVGDYAAGGSGSGFLGAGYLRAGVLWTPDAVNQVLFSASIKQSALGMASFVETDPEADPNLFSADYSGMGTSVTTFKAGADWTTQLATDMDLTASAAIGASMGSGATADIFGVGPVSGSAQSTVFAQYGLRLGWEPAAGTRLDGFVMGTTGTGIGTHAQIGAAYRMIF